MRESSISMSYGVINWSPVWFSHFDTCLPYFMNPTTVGSIALLQLKVKGGHLGKISPVWSDQRIKGQSKTLKVISLSCYLRVVICRFLKSDDRQPCRTCPRGHYLLRICSSSRCRSPSFRFVKIFYLFIVPSHHFCPFLSAPIENQSDNQGNDLP